MTYVNMINGGLSEDIANMTSANKQMVDAMEAFARLVTSHEAQLLGRTIDQFDIVKTHYQRDIEELNSDYAGAVNALEQIQAHHNNGDIQGAGVLGGL